MTRRIRRTGSINHSSDLFTSPSRDTKVVKAIDSKLAATKTRSVADNSKMGVPNLLISAITVHRGCPQIRRTCHDTLTGQGHWLFQITRERRCAGKAGSGAVTDQGIHILGKRDQFRPFGGKFTRFLWDKKTSQYPINAFPPTLYSGSDASLVPACPRLSHALPGTNNCFTVSSYSHLCAPFRDFLKKKITLSYSRGKLTISAK